MSHIEILNKLECLTKEGESPVRISNGVLADFPSSVYWNLGMNLGDTNFQT